MILVVTIYSAIINILALIVFYIDKVKAVRGKWRISEKTLIFLCLIGGAVGGLLGMLMFHHKTKRCCL